MLHHGERVAAGPSSRLRAWIYTKSILFRDDVAVGSPDLARIGLIALALALQTIVLFSPGHFRPAGEEGFAVFVAAGTLASLGLCLAATLPIRVLLGVHLRRALAAAALATLAILPVLGVWHGSLGVNRIVHGSPYSNDGAVMDLYAAEQVRHGHDPYLRTNIVLALAHVDAPSTTTTPLMRGQFSGARSYPSAAAVQQVFLNVLRYRPRTIPPEFESKYNYPSGSFLFILPFVWMGIRDMRFLYALFVLLMGAYMWWRMPPSLRLLVPLIVLGNVPLIILTAGGQPDPIYGLFLMVGFAEWASPRLSPAFMGIAIGTKQLAWFFAPFYLLLIARELGWREAVRRAGIMACVFGIMNLPFIVQSPSSYLSSISGPMSDPMFPLGIGVIAVFVSNVLPMLPKVAFTVLELSSWLGGAVASARVRYLTAGSGAALAALPLFFAWRSLVNYFYLVPFIALAVVLAEPAQRKVLRRSRG